MKENKLKDKIRGSLIGGAIGDALGYPVEFMSYKQIVGKYGDKGITRYELYKNGVAEISDDTQMTLFTANGLLFGCTRGAMRGIMANPSDYIRDSYMEWYQTQTGETDYTMPHYNWIREVKELHARRAPGNTCLQALHELSKGQEANNNSKGCGGIMRIAPLPLFYCRWGEGSAFCVKEAGACAAITHKHPLGYLPAALLAHLIYRLSGSTAPTSYQIARYVEEGIKLLNDVYPDHAKHIADLKNLLEKAARRAVSTLPDEEAIRQIGEGWVAEETLAIALFCVMRYPDDFERAIVAAVNHSGDSDSTGAVAGNLMGVIVGYDAIPDYYKEHLELRWLIEEIADDLADGIPVSEFGANDTPEQRRWIEKYIYVFDRDRVPVKNSYCVDADLCLFAGEYPGDKDNDRCRAKIGSSFSYVLHFFDLTEVGELNPYSQYLKNWQTHHRFPIPDTGVPRDTAGVRRLIEEILSLRESVHDEHGKIYIHSWGGVGRTGTIVACVYAYLLRGKGLSADAIYEQAMKQLAESFARCPKSRYRMIPDNDLQRNFVRRFVCNECV